jgi:hypothetical protein
VVILPKGIALKDYHERNHAVHKIGFRSYPKYLSSPLWRAIKKRLLPPGTDCRICEREATELHHKEYSEKVLLGEDDEKLVPLCRSCHGAIEFCNGEKRTLLEANALLIAVAR